jgi:hypothetical protein
MDIFDFGNARGEKEPSANDARIVCNKGGTSLTTHTSFSTVGEGILFGVYGSLFMVVADNRRMGTSG